MSSKSGSDLNTLLMKDLQVQARKMGLTGYSRLRKAELIEAIQAAMPKKSAKKTAASKKSAAAKKSTPVKKKAALAAKKSTPAKKKAAPARKKSTLVEPKYSSAELQEIDSQAQNLPGIGQDNRIVLLPRDPSWLFTYWELTPEYKEAARRAGGEVLALRLHDLTGVTGTTANASFEHEVSEWARSWYLPVPAPEREYAVEIGYRGGGQWFPLVRSNTVVVPAEQPSAWIAQQYATISPEDELTAPADEAAAAGETDMRADSAPAAAATMAQVLVDEGELRIVLETRAPVAAGSPGTSADLAAGPGSPDHLAGSLGQVPGSLGHLAGSLGQVPGSLGHLPGSLGLLPPGASAASPLVLAASDTARRGDIPVSASALVKASGGQPLLEASVEVVLTGRAYPGATLSVAGRPVPVGPDGAFGLRISVPEGTQEVPIEALEEATGQRRRISLKLGRVVE